MRTCRIVAVLGAIALILCIAVSPFHARAESE